MKRFSHAVNTKALLVLIAFGLASSPGGGEAADPDSSEGYLEIRPVLKVVAVLTYDVSYSDLKGTEWVMFGSRAPDLVGQIKVKSAIEPPGEPTKEHGDLGRDLLLAKVVGDAQHPLNALKMKINYEATLQSRKLRRGTGSRRVMELSPADRQKCLADYGYFDLNSAEFRDWVKSRAFERRKNEKEIAFARRVFLGIKSSFQYEAGSKLDWHASAVCKSGRSDCGGLSVLFASIMRANKIPARTLWGRWAHSSEPGKMLGGRPYHQTHVKAEFYARRIGWVPVDLSSAILHDKTPQGLRFFASDPGDFLAFHVDANFEIDTQVFGVKPVSNLQLPRWWIKGTGALKDRKIVEDWQVQRTKLRRN